jgi:hypothetical protein
VNRSQKVDAGRILYERRNATDQLKQKPMVGLLPGIEAEGIVPGCSVKKVVL